MPTPSAGASYTTTYAYDALNRPLGASWNPAPAQATPTASSASFAFTYDGTNRRIGQSATDKSWWDYPTTASSVSYTANSLNQYSLIASVSPSYDGNGNLTYDGTFTYAYDAENRLVSIAQGGSPVAGYGYDAEGRRKTKTVGSTTTVYVTDADNREVLEYDGTSGQVERWYAYGLGPDNVLGQMNIAAGTRETMIPDIQGSIVAMLDSGSAALLKTGYQPYGENPSLTSGTYQYTARRFDPETAGSTAEPSGLYYYRARHYSPTLGRFLQPDPLGYTAGNNLYAYVNNDPLNLTDPSGEYFGIDDLLFSGGGALLGLGAQAVHDLVTGQLSSKGAYAGAVLGGAVGGEALLYTGPIGAGAAAGFVSNATTQAIDIATGNQSQFSGSALAISTGLGAAAGLIPGVSVPGITAGRNSANAIFNQIVTKAENGTINSISGTTAANMVAGRFVSAAQAEGAAAVGLAAGTIDLLNQPAK